MIPQDPNEISRLRISDADRDRAASILNDAFAAGRLTAEEHSQRLDAIYAAKTHADLVPVVDDLPGANAALAYPASSPARYDAAGPATPGGGPGRLVSIFSSISRRGAWRVPAEVSAVSVFGNTELDFRQAVLSARETKIRAVCVFGNTEITVPPEMHVIDDGLAILGGREIPPDTEESAGPDASVLRITGISLFGMISVRRKRRKGTAGKDLSRNS